MNEEESRSSLFLKRGLTFDRLWPDEHTLFYCHFSSKASAAKKKKIDFFYLNFNSLSLNQLTNQLVCWQEQKSLLKHTFSFHLNSILDFKILKNSAILSIVYEIAPSLCSLHFPYCPFLSHRNECHYFECLFHDFLINFPNRSQLCAPYVSVPINDIS